MKRTVVIGAAAVVVVAAALAIWLANRTPAPDKPPSGAPAVGSCWSVDLAAAQGTLPWAGGPVACTAAHTAEIFQVGQVDRQLVKNARSSDADTATLAKNLMYAEARRTCAKQASTYLGANWHQEQVTVLASWIAPAREGFYGCALAQTADPGAQRLISRTGSLKGGAGQLAIECVVRAGDGSLGYSACTDPHDGEFVGVYAVTPANAPFDATSLRTALTKGCGEVEQSYLGLPQGAGRADLSVGYVGPTSAQTWLGSDQTFACYTMASVKLRGTIRSLGTRPLPR